MPAFDAPVKDKVAALEGQLKKIEQMKKNVTASHPAQGTYETPSNAFEKELRAFVEAQAEKDPAAFAKKLCETFRQTHVIRSAHGGAMRNSIEAPLWLVRAERHVMASARADAQGVPYGDDTARMEKDAQALRETAHALHAQASGRKKRKNDTGGLSIIQRAVIAGLP